MSELSLTQNAVAEPEALPPAQISSRAAKLTKARPAEQASAPAQIMVRQAGRRDLLTVCRIECASFGFARLLSGLWPLTGNRGVRAWIVEADQRPAGYLVAYKNALNDRWVMYVGGVGVLPEHRKCGLATRLMRIVLGEYRSVWLHVRASNASAIAVYRKLGMGELRRIPRFYPNGENAIVMATQDLIATAL